MSQNLKLGYGLARVYGFTGIMPHGAYYRREGFYLPSPGYCRHVLRQFRQDTRKVEVVKSSDGVFYRMEGDALQYPLTTNDVG